MDRPARGRLVDPQPRLAAYEDPRTQRGGDTSAFTTHDPAAGVVYLPGLGAEKTRWWDRLGGSWAPGLAWRIAAADPARVNTAYTVLHGHRQADVVAIVATAPGARQAPPGPWYSPPGDPHRIPLFDRGPVGSGRTDHEALSPVVRDGDHGRVQPGLLHDALE